MNSKLSTAMFANSLPCNPLPFLHGLRAMVLAGEPLTTDVAKRVLWTLLAIVRGQFFGVNLAANASFHREHLARLPGRDTPLGVMDAMLREAEGLGTDDICRNWWSSISSLILFAWGEVEAEGTDGIHGILDSMTEWVRLHDSWQDEQAQAATAQAA